MFVIVFELSILCVLSQAALREKFAAAAMSFDKASRDRSPEEAMQEKAFEKALRTPSHLGMPNPVMPVEGTVACSPDYTQCPIGWERKGNVCEQVGHGKGPKQGKCATRYAFGTLTVAQKAALAQNCDWTFPCQAIDCEVAFDEPCPNSWVELSFGQCKAPAAYVGDCAREINVTGRLLHL